MEKEARPFFYAGALTITIFLFINLIGFVLHWFRFAPEGEWSVRFKHGTLYLNEVATGMVWGQTLTGIILFVVFLASFLLFRMRVGK